MTEILDAPGFLADRSTLGSDVSYLFAVTFTILFLISGVLAAKNRGRAHHWMILISMTSMFAYFVFYYKIRSLGLESFSDQIDFKGPPWVYDKIFTPALYLHFLAVSLSTFMAIYMIGNGFRTAVMRNNRLGLRNKPVTRSIINWIPGFIWLAIVVWWVFSAHRFGWGHRLMFIFIGYLAPAGIVTLIGRTLPYSDRRHRVLGKLTLAFFGLLLLSSTLVYYLLYMAF